ncbi:MAG: glycosyltransferase family 1 protein [bacterium]
MNIGFSSFVLQGGKTGVASYIVNLLDALERMDRTNTYDVMLPESEEALIPVHSPNFKKTMISDRLSKPVANILWHNLCLPGRSRQERYDLVHVPSYRRLPLLKGTKIVATVHDLATLHIDAKYDAARMFYNRRIVPSLIRRADHIITVSQYTADDIVNLVGYPKERISVIYSGINQRSYFPVPAAEARLKLAEKYRLESPFIVFVSRVEHPAKNHVRLIQAFERLKAAHPSDIKLVLAGADWNGADVVKAVASASPVARDIMFPGFVPLSDIPFFYSACELMVYPSLFEGFGFPIVEALACGAPVICSNTSSMQEIAADFVQKFDPLNIDEMLARMEDALKRGHDAELSARGQAYSAGFNWDQTAQKVMEVYRKVGTTSYGN